MNPLFNPNQNMNPMLKQFQQFRNTFKGDPKQQVQNMLNSGQISQEQYNNAVKMANQFKNLIK